MTQSQIPIHGHQRCSSRVVRERYGQGILSSARHPMTGQAQLLPILKCNRPNLTLCVLEPPALDARVLRDTTDSVEGIPRVGSSPALGPTWTSRPKSKNHQAFTVCMYGGLSRHGSQSGDAASCNKYRPAAKETRSEHSGLV